MLVVDDSGMQRRILSAMLARAGHEVIEAASADEALERCRRAAPDIVLSDWVMPGLSGLELCRLLREGAAGGQGYVYFILMSSRTDKPDITQGLRAGADDFLTKPVNAPELMARLAAGGRILTMQRELRQQNRLIAATLDELRGLYDTLDRDLIEARRLQQSLVRERVRSFGGADVAVLLCPAGRIGGDLAGFFPINARRVGLYSIDVSGHGVTSALITARLAGHLSASLPENNLALMLSDYGIYDGRPPAEVAQALNQHLLAEMETESYLTLLYADVDLVNGEVAMVQAGHPHPAVLRADGRVEFPGEGGLPVGLLEEARYQDFRFRLTPGERLFIMSDGLTEARGTDGTLLGETGVAALIRAHAGLGAEAFAAAMLADVQRHCGSDLADDVSGVVLDFRAAKAMDG